MTPPATPEPGWYRADGDPPGTHRYWNGETWVGEPQPLPPSVTDPPAPMPDDLASPVQRIVGRLIDAVLLGGVLLLIRALIDDGISETPSRTSLLVGLVVAVVYEIGMVAGIGATVGKLVVGTKVVSSDGASPPPPGVASLRWLPNAISVVPVLGVLVGMAIVLASLIWIFTDPRRRTIYDRAATTHVARSR